MEKREKGSVVGSSPIALMGSGGVETEEVSGGLRSAETMLRLVPVALCVSALVVMLKSSESSDFGYLVHANGICAGYSLLSAIIAAMPRPPTMPRAWTLFFLDQVLTYVILGAGAVATEVVYLAHKGDTAIAWSEACGTFGGFCHKATASVIITFVVVAFYAVLSLISSYKLFSKFDAPMATPIKGLEVTTFGA
ncbi:CASP-like protein F16 isoform X2 [Carica papaya]|uniref:CASP-like protein F16 isoform X2 n=1 Tax=Carica papaya TaxID=3649 RepID=UPI000B8CC8D4|nr:CASP-like protein F16 isoform X2 [Carica papaya]